MRTLVFDVLGIAQPKGSAKAYIPKGWSRPIITSDNPKVKTWQRTIAQSAKVAIGATGLFPGAVHLEVTFALARPKALKTNKPHLTRPDLDKCVRSVGDALTGVVWADDSQVVGLVARKRYVHVDEAPHVSIAVHEQEPL